MIEGAQLLSLPCDVLVPAAIGSVITSENAHTLNCKYVVEAANGPTTPNVSYYSLFFFLLYMLSSALYACLQRKCTCLLRIYQHCWETILECHNDELWATHISCAAKAQF